MYVGFNGTFITLAIVGMMGMSRRYATYPPSFQIANDFATAFAYFLGLSILPFLVNVVVSWRWGKRPAQNPWLAHSLEWLTPTPVPLDNFEEIPLVVADPYQYGVVPGVAAGAEVTPMALLKPSKQATAGRATTAGR
jgi:cytochrome c oxidase subunit 1